MANSDQSETEDTIPVGEWVVAAAGALLVIGSFGFLAYRAISEKLPPAFTVEIKNIEQVNENVAVSVVVNNEGGQPVANLSVTGKYARSEERNVIIDYLPAHSSRRVTFLFDQSIEREKLVFTFDSYSQP